MLNIWLEVNIKRYYEAVLANAIYLYIFCLISMVEYLNTIYTIQVAVFDLPAPLQRLKSQV